MVWHIISQDGSQIIKQTFETQEEAQNFLDNTEFDGVVTSREDLEAYLQKRAEWQQTQQQEQQPQQQDHYGPDLSEEEYLEQNRIHNQRCREKRLLFIPKREQPLHTQPAFNQRPVGHNFNHPPINQSNFRAHMIPVNLIRPRPIRRQY